MNVVHGIDADHHKYIINGLIDADVVREQSRRQWEQRAETTVIHWHKADNSCPDNSHESFGISDEAMATLLRPLVNKT